MDSNTRVYVLRNPAGRLYIGVSEDVLRRLEQHNSGMSNGTRSRGPWCLVWQSDLKGQKGGRQPLTKSRSHGVGDD